MDEELRLVFAADVPVVVRVRHELPPYQQRLLAALGAGYVVDAAALRCERPCGRPECRPIYRNQEERTMSTSAHEVTETQDCKTPGCTNLAVAKLGRYAGLCSEHIQRARRNGTAPIRPVSPAPTRPAAGGTFVDKVKQVSVLAREVDKLKATATRHTERALAAKRAADAKEREFAQLVRSLELAGGDA